MSADTPWPEYAAASEGQRLAALPDHSAWVEANAGSGKTKVLIDRVARLLLRGVEPDSILCVTYTKAAASEMQGRLFQRLGDWCVMDEATLRGKLAELETRPVTDYGPDDIGRARELFAKALETPGGLRIETIHAFCGRVLRRFPLEADVAPGFREIDDDESADIWEASFRTMASRVVAGDEKLKAAARAVAEAGGKGLDIARDLLSRRAAIQAFIARSGGIDKAVAALKHTLGAPDLSPEEIIARAMGSELPRAKLQQAQAAYATGGKRDQEQAERIAFALSDASAESRFASLLNVFLTQKGEQKARGSVFTKGVAASYPIVIDLFDVDSPQGSETLRLERAMQDVRAARLFARSAAILRLADMLFRDFGERKRARAGLDFDDLIETTASLLTRQHAAEWVLWKLDGGISHILLDEAQDTSPSQWRILKALTDDIFAGAGSTHSATRTLFVVGDQKQSIYSFQGADPEHFLFEKQQFISRAEAASVDHELPGMAMSFRSVQQVLDFVDTAFDTAAFDGQAPFTVLPPEEADLLRHTAHRRHEPGSVELWPLEPQPEVEPAEPWDSPKGQESVASPKARLAERIAGFIKQEITSGAAVWDKKQHRPARPGDFLILVRGRTGGLFDGILQALKREQIPVAGADRLQLLDSLPVQDLLNLIRFALCPSDDLTLAEIIKGPLGAYGDPSNVQWLGEDELYALAHGREGRLWPALRASQDPRFAPLRAYLADLLARTHQPPYEFLVHALERGTGLPRPGWSLILSRFGLPAREPVTALIDRAAAWDADEPPSLQLFLDAIERRGGEVKRELSGPQNEVRVMTVHGAKGLEAPIVILPDTVAGPGRGADLFVTREGEPVWPGAKGNDTNLSARLRLEAEARNLREHRRLLYVALTRAQDRLVICGAARANSKDGHDKASWYRVCEAAMGKLTNEGRAAEATRGDHTFLRAGDPPPNLSAALAVASTTAALPAWLDQPAPAEAGRRLLSPSRLTASAEPPVLSPFGAGRAEKLRRGTLIHTLFEVLPGLPAKTRWRAAENFLKKQPDLTPAQRTEMLDAAFGVLDDPRFANVFGPGGRPEAPVIGDLGNGRIINGRVDRLVVTPSEILVIDYKTDRPAPPSVESVGEAYIAQMAAYREVLSRRWPDRPVRCLLVWTDGPKPMEIPAEMLDSALNRLR